MPKRQIINKPLLEEHLDVQEEEDKFVSKTRLI